MTTPVPQEEIDEEDVRWAKRQAHVEDNGVSVVTGY